jgi:hypothetical protein
MNRRCRKKNGNYIITRVVFLATQGRRHPWMSGRKQEHIGINFLLGVKSSIDLLGRRKCKTNSQCKKKTMMTRSNLLTEIKTRLLPTDY